MKQLLASQEVLHPRLFYSIMSAITPLMAIDKTGVNLNTLLGGRKVAKVAVDKENGGDGDKAKVAKVVVAKEENSEDGDKAKAGATQNS